MAEPGTYGDLLMEALERAHGPVSFPPGAIEASMAEVQRRLSEALAELTATPDEPDLEAFLDDGRPLSHDRQRQLFADPALRTRFRAMTAGRAVARPSRGADARFLEMPTQVAAATAADETFERRFPGGVLRISPVGIDRQVYVIIALDDAEVTPRALLMERDADGRIARLPLPPPDAGEIVLVRDMAVAEDADLIALLRDPLAAGTFLG